MRNKILAITVSAALLLGTILPLSMIGDAEADPATGDLLRRFDVTQTAPGVVPGIGIAFDGTNLWITEGFCFSVLHNIDTNGNFLNSITVTDPSGLVPSGSPPLDVCALAYDRTNNKLWGALITVIPPTFVEIDPATGIVQSAIQSPGVHSEFIDGLTFDELTNTLWVSPDPQPPHTAYQVNAINGLVVNNVGLPFTGAEHYSGIATDGFTLWNNQNAIPLEMVQLDLVGNQITSFRDDLRGEDLAYDEVTFAPLCAIWEITLAGNISAYEVPCREPAIEVEKFYTFTDVDVEDGEFGTPLPIDDDSGKFLLEAVVKKRQGTVASYNPGQYYAVTKINVNANATNIWIFELFGNCTDREDPAGNVVSISKVNPDRVPGGALVAIMDPNGVVTDISGELAKSDNDGDGLPDLRLTDSNNNGITDNAEAHLENVEAGSMVFFYVKFGPGLKGEELPEDPFNMCTNTEVVRAQIDDEAISAEAQADLIVLPKQ